MQVPIDVEAKMTVWDAKKAYPDGLEGLPGDPDDISDLVGKIARAIVTEGKVVVLPGPVPHQALVITMDGTGDGSVVEGSLEVEFGERSSDRE